LQDALKQTNDPAVKLALAQSITSNTQSFLETRRIYSNMVNISEAMTQLLHSSNGQGSKCQDILCGHHATCTETTLGAQCVCNEGYVGLGQNCHAPPEFLPHHLIIEDRKNPTVASDISVCSFAGKIAVVYRAMSKQHIGEIVIGNVRDAGTVDLLPPQQFTTSNGQAFQPVVQGTDSGRFVIAWRDNPTSGTSWLRGAVLGTSGIRGADMAALWGEPISFAESQAHKMQLLALTDNNFALMFVEKVKAKRNLNLPPQSFGKSVLADVGLNGSVSVKGVYRFLNSPVCRLEAMKLTPTSFILAMRAARDVNEMTNAIIRQEAIAMYAELIDGNLVFDPNPVNLEPYNTNIWARGISLIAPNTFAYAYQDGTNMEVKMAVVHVEPKTHRMKVVHQPQVMHKGFSPYIAMLSVPYTASDPHTLTYFEKSGSSTVNICAWNAKAHKLARCQDFIWMTLKVTSMSGVPLGGGKALMVFTPPSGVPLYGVFGLSKK